MLDAVMPPPPTERLFVCNVSAVRSLATDRETAVIPCGALTDSPPIPVLSDCTVTDPPTAALLLTDSDTTERPAAELSAPDMEREPMVTGPAL